MEVSDSLKNKVYDAFNSAVIGGNVRKGTNEATKAIERSTALLVATAKDVSPPEIVAHISILCKEKGIPFVEVPNKAELGKAVGLSVPTSAAAIVRIDNKKILDTVLAELGGKGAPKAEKKEEKKEAKEEVKKEEAPKGEVKEAPKEEPKKEEKAEAKEEKKEEAPKEKAPKKEKKKE